MTTSREKLLALMDAALKAADPGVQIPRNLPEPPKGKTIVIGAGKASANMARAFEKAWKGDVEGLVVTRYGHAVECDQIEIVEASHPVPDAAGEKAAKRILDIVSDAGPEDLVVCMIS
ncbi:MAG TPA: glycerate kinase, partial [Thalassospira sp.]|nr:glycerate kinase [Thalassospira sp.]